MKNSKNDNIKEYIRQTITKILAKVPFLRVEEKQTSFGNVQPDLVFLVNDGIRSKYIIVEVKSLGEPRYIRSAIQRLKEYLIQFQDTYGVLGAPYISNDTAKICKKSGVGYVDTAGNCLINFNKIFVERKNFPNPNIKKRIARSIFSTKSTRILRIMLCNPKRLWQVQELAKEANVSLGLAYKVKERLLDLEYAAEKKKSVSLSRPQELLNKWAENYTFRKNELYDCFSIKSVKEMEQDLSRYCRKKQISYALTLFSGASLVAPFARYTRSFAYIKDTIGDVKNALELKPVDSGANFTLMIPYDDGVFFGTRKIKGFTVVSNVQLYLDLMSFKGRGEESAQFLLEQKLKPQW